MKSIFTSFFFLAMANLFAQNETVQDHFKCGTYAFTESFFEAHPGQRAVAEAAKATLDNFTRNYSEDLQKDNDVLIIPVVFHIIHTNGPENISDEQVHSAIEVMNEDYSASNPGIGSVIPLFENNIANVRFEFRLAKRDPDGNCTNGIVRVFNAETAEGGNNLKQISPSWGRSSYLNIWVCKQIGGGVAGYAYLPNQVAGSNGAEIDGIVIQHNYVGRIGTGSADFSHSLSHEVGHWANLIHTWGPSNEPGLNSNCNIDDGIADTPNTEGWLTCDVFGNTCGGSVDNVQNFMEYSYCSEMFTEGQKTRMRAALHSYVSSRNDLWTEQNLIDTGVLEDDMVCEADFKTMGGHTICIGQQVVFTDLSYNAPTAWAWIFEGGSPTTSGLQNPVVTFSQPGVYSVSLTASNAGGNATVTKTNFITVLESASDNLPAEEGFEDFSVLPQSYWFVANPDNSSIKWVLTTEASYSGSKSVRVRGRLNYDGAKEALISPVFDLTGVSEGVKIEFKYAHALRSASSSDQMKIFISADCGGNWIPWFTLDENLPTVPGSFFGEFVPDSQDDWDEVSIDVLASSLMTGTFRFKIEFTSNSGNDIYVDNINIFDPNAVGLEEIEFLNYLKVYPNPASTQITLKYYMVQGADIRISVSDVLGREIIQPITHSKASGEQIEKIDIHNLSPGIYFVSIHSKGEQAVRKLIVK